MLKFSSILLNTCIKKVNYTGSLTELYIFETLQIQTLNTEMNDKTA